MFPACCHKKKGNEETRFFFFIFLYFSFSPQCHLPPPSSSLSSAGAIWGREPRPSCTPTSFRKESPTENVAGLRYRHRAGFRCWCWVSYRYRQKARARVWRTVGRGLSAKSELEMETYLLRTNAAPFANLHFSDTSGSKPRARLARETPTLTGTTCIAHLLSSLTFIVTHTHTHTHAHTYTYMHVPHHRRVGNPTAGEPPAAAAEATTRTAAPAVAAKGRGPGWRRQPPPKPRRPPERRQVRLGELTGRIEPPPPGAAERR